MENQSSVNTTQSQDLQMPSKDIFIGFYIALVLLSLIGNTLIITVVMLNRNLRTEFNYLIVNMAVSDLLLSIVGLPLAIVDMYNKYKWLVDGLAGVVLCKLSPFLADISGPVSIISLVAVSINRFLASVYPVRQKTLTVNLNRILIIITWVVPIGFFAPYFYANTVNSDEVCGPFKFNESQRGIYMRIATTIFFVIPLAIITVLYATIVIKVQKSSAVLNEMLNKEQMRRRRQMSRQVFLLSIVIIGTFVILWGPYQVMLLLLSFGLPAFQFLKFQWLVLLLSYFTIVVNPMICFIFFNNYRIGLKNVFLRLVGNYEETTTTIGPSSSGGKSRMTTAL